MSSRGVCLDLALPYSKPRKRQIRTKPAVEASTSTLAGSGIKGYADGENAQLKGPHGIAVADDVGTLIMADCGNHVVRRIYANGEVSTIAGSGKAGFKEGVGAAAQFHSPAGVAVDVEGNIIVADFGKRTLAHPPDTARTAWRGAARRGAAPHHTLANPNTNLLARSLAHACMVARLHAGDHRIHI